jgi:hypothetical protein
MEQGMDKRRRLGALIGAGLLTVAAASTAFAAAPTFTISVTKTADPTAVPVGGADVDFTVNVENTGTGDFHTLGLVDSLSGCSLAGPTGDTGSDGILSSGETWTYTCTVTGVTPDTTNTVTVHACHNSSPSCTQANQTTSGQGQVTVGTAEATVAPTEAPSEAPTGAPATDTPAPTGAGAGDTNVPSEPPTDTIVPGGSAPTDSAWFLVAALGVFLGSLAVLRPSRANKPH